MANKPLQSIKFPGLSDTYIVPQIDNTLTHPGQAADAKKTGDEITGLKEDLSNLVDFTVPVNAGVNVGTMIVGQYVKPSDGANSSVAYGCRTGYISVSGLNMLKVGFDRTVYEYTVWGYSSNSVADAVKRLTDNNYSSNEELFIDPGETIKSIRIGVVRKDRQGTITAEDAETIKNGLTFFKFTDTTLTINGVPADSKKVGDEIGALTEDLHQFYEFMTVLDSTDVGTLVPGNYVVPSTGSNGAVSYGCRTAYIDISCKLKLVIEFDTSVYKYVVWGYSEHDVTSAVKRYHDSPYSTDREMYIACDDGITCIRIGIIRIDMQGTITEQEAATIKANIKFERITDTTLSKDGDPADAKVTGDKIAKLESVLCGIVAVDDITVNVSVNGITADGANINDASNRARTGYTPVGGVIKAYLVDNTYTMVNAFLYTSESYTTVQRRLDGSGTKEDPVFAALNPDTEKYFKASFKLTADSEHIMTDADLEAIAEKLIIVEYTDKSLSRSNVAADSKAVGDAVKQIREASMRLYNTEEFGYAFGGLTSSGARVPNSTNRLRITDNENKDTFFIKKNSTISVDSGYKFNVAQFTAKNDMYELIEMRSMSTDDFTASNDCYVRISIGRTDNGDLWETVGDEKVILSAGTDAIAACHFTLIGQTSMELADQLSEGLYKNYEMISLTKPIPYNAEEYHALYDDLVEAGILTRSEAYYCTSDTEHKWPLYTYTIKRNHDFLNASYSQNQYDGTNDLYQRKKVLIVSGIHGSERATPSYLYEFINRLFNSPANASLLTTYDWTIVPLVNPWGYSHSLVNGNGTIYHGQSMTVSGYTRYENNDTNKYDGGLRRNADNIDINRDFSDGSGFQTEEAVYVRNVLTSDHFDYAFDFHQAYFNDNRCAFASLSYNATDEIKNKMFKSVVKAGAETDVAASADTNNQSGSQTSFPWVGSNLHTFRNYAGGYSNNGEGNDNYKAYAVATTICAEMSTTCVPYSNSKESYNSVSQRYGNTFINNLIKNVLTD